jgi:hypothetical protein
MTTVGTQRAEMVNSFFGVDGVERIDGGFRGHTTVCRGRLRGLKSGGGADDLLAAIGAFRELFDGRSYVLVDSFGYSWNNVVMEAFDLDANAGVQQTPREYFQMYTAAFRHLSRT